MGTTAEDLNEAVMLRRELLASGFTDAQIRAQVRRGNWTRIRHGTYVDRPFWESLSREAQHRLLIRAVLKRAHPSTVATNVSAAVERGAPVWGISLENVHVARLDGRTSRNEAGVIHHSGRMTEADVEIVNGIAVTRAARCALEVTTDAGVEPALVTVNGLLNAGALTVEQFADEVAACKYWPDSLTSTLVLRLCDARMQSAGESRAWHLFWAQHLPKPTPQLPIFDEHGELVGYVDFAWEEAGVFLEFDGRIKYEKYRLEGESLEEFLMREKRREELICALTGWVCIRIQWADLARPERIATRIRRLLDARRRPIGA